MRQLLILILSLAFSIPSYASNYDGVASLFIALPLLVLSNLIIGLFFIFRASRFQKTLAKILFIPAILICTVIFFIDALPLIGQVEVMNPDSHGLLFYFGYIGLLGPLVYLLTQQVVTSRGSMFFYNYR